MIKKNLIDLPLISVTLILLVFGLIAIYDASAVAAFRDFEDKLYYFKNQLIWASLGVLSLAFFSLFDYHKILKNSPKLLLLSSLFLILVLIPGIGAKVYGARRWINIGNFTFQPSEPAKLFLIFYLSEITAKLAQFKIKLTDAIVVILLPTAIITGLVLVQPDLGTALIFIAISIIIYFTGHSPIWHFVLTIPLVIIAATVSIFSSPYRVSRLKSFLDPTHDPQGASYQIYQILIALSSGGLFGVGLGASRSKFAFIPQVHNDAIFAIIVEELGFVGAAILIGLFLFMIERAIKIARGARDIQGRVLALGITALIAVQSFFNFASMVALVPLTGIPLPLISYGGSSLLVTMTAIGILLNIKRQS